MSRNVNPAWVHVIESGAEPHEGVRRKRRRKPARMHVVDEVVQRPLVAILEDEVEGLAVENAADEANHSRR